MIPYKYCTLRTSDFPFVAKKQLHTLTPINANFTILRAVTNIFIRIGGYEVTSCSSMEPSMAGLYTYCKVAVNSSEQLWLVLGHLQL